MTHTIEWIDHNREPQCPPDPDYPKGKDIVLGLDGMKACTVDLPYPAKRCGLYVIKCKLCALKVGVTTAGRPDDPRSVQFPCQETRQ